MQMISEESQGQALVETIFIIPIFFLILSGILFLFQSQMRILTDENVVNGQIVSAAYLMEEEKWSIEKSEELIAKQVHYSFMPSKFFLNSVDQIDGLFLDKIPLTQQESNTCDKNNPRYQIYRQEKGFFNLTTCAHESQYEREKKPPFFKSSQAEVSHYLAQNLFYPAAYLQLKEKEKKISSAYSDFFKESEFYTYEQQQASILFSSRGEFNQSCFMQPFSPVCSLQSVEHILTRTTVDTAKWQLRLCVAEAVAKCGVTGPAVAVCVAGKLLQIKNAIELGVEAWVCPILNASVKSIHSATQTYIFFQLQRLKGEEALFKSEIMSYIQAF